MINNLSLEESKFQKWLDEYELNSLKDFFANFDPVIDTIQKVHTYILSGDLEQIQVIHNKVSPLIARKLRFYLFSYREQSIRDTASKFHISPLLERNLKEYLKSVEVIIIVLLIMMIKLQIIYFLSTIFVQTKIVMIVIILILIIV